MTERFAYDPYGNVTVLSASWGSASDNTWQIRFQGMWLDNTTGLYKTLNRDYSPTEARWIEADPAGYGNGSNLYQALDSDPASLLDPAGLEPTTQPALTVGGGQSVPLADNQASDGYGTVGVNTSTSINFVHVAQGEDYRDTDGVSLQFNASKAGCSCHWYQWVTVHLYKFDNKAGYVEQQDVDVPFSVRNHPEQDYTLSSGHRYLDVKPNSTTPAYDELGLHGDVPTGGIWIYDNPTANNIRKLENNTDKVVMSFVSVLVCDGKVRYTVQWQVSSDEVTPQKQQVTAAGPASSLPDFAQSPSWHTGIPAGQDENKTYRNPVARNAW